MCQEERPWLIHLGLMASYVTMLVLIMFFLSTMQAGPEIHWSVHVLWLRCVGGPDRDRVYMLHGRLKKSRTHFQHSHESDWIFLIMLFSSRRPECSSTSSTGRGFRSRPTSPTSCT